MYTGEIVTFILGMIVGICLTHIGLFNWLWTPLF